MTSSLLLLKLGSFLRENKRSHGELVSLNKESLFLEHIAENVPKLLFLFKTVET